jgi:anti-anti-sigma factor
VLEKVKLRAQPRPRLEGAVELTHYQCEIVSNDGQAMIRLSGEVDLAALPVVAQAANEALELSPGSLVVDLAEVTFIDSAGLSALIKMRAAARAVGVPLLVSSPSKVVMRVMEVSGIDRLFEFDH